MQYGKNIIENGFSNIDTLTWHENLEFPHSGLFDIIIYWVYNLSQDFSSIYVYTCLMVCVLLGILFFVSYKLNKSMIASLVYIFIAWYLGSPTFYARAFQFSFIFFVLEFYFLQKLIEENKKRYSIGIIVLGILIANIHSSVYPIYFVMFLPHIAEIILSKFNVKIPKLEIERRRGTKLLLITFGIALFTGLCTSAGFAPYTDMIKVMFGISSDFIGEIAPTSFKNNKIFYPIVLATLLFIINGKQKIKITDIFYILGFGILTVVVFRGFFFFVFLSGISITRIVVSYFKENDVKVNKYLKYASFVMGSALFIISVCAHAFRVMDYQYVEDRSYPIGVCDYILENVDLDKMKIYNGFNYGSYLEYRGIKAFIDSRSGMFCEEFNKGCTILKDWYSIYNDENPYQDIFDKYGITHVVTARFDSLSNKLKEDEEWKIIYEDKYWELYTKNGD